MITEIRSKFREENYFAPITDKEDRAKAYAFISKIKADNKSFLEACKIRYGWDDEYIKNWNQIDIYVILSKNLFSWMAIRKKINDRMNLIVFHEDISILNALRSNESKLSGELAISIDIPVAPPINKIAPITEDDGLGDLFSN